ncbi:blood vessel epicardial substance-like isoform X2 [Penaeus indicus]|uniref:blood vessel epicardial substance-like isoform X2 n=1 Tax=Penaeus indicus TaxID=29960 RepID=UPI00300DAE78
MLVHNGTDNTLGGPALTKVARVDGVLGGPIFTTTATSAATTAATAVAATTATTTAAAVAALQHHHAEANFTLGTLYNDSGGSDAGGGGGGAGGGGRLGGLETDFSWAEGLNDSLAATVTGFLMGNVTDEGVAAENVTAAERIVYCKEWTGATLTLFQVANFFCLLAFLVPHNFRLSALVMRAVLSVGILLFALWAALDICAADIFAWNLSFLVVNAAHVLHLTYTVWPPRVHQDLADLYAKVFKPLRVNRQNFSALVKEATLMRLEVGDTYAVEDTTAADERLSILLSGKLRVSCDNTHLHNILPTHFIDSPEWEACADDSDELFQVTIVAEEPSEYLCWSRPRLRHVLHLRPFLRAVMHNLIGKDITTKLYSQHEQLGVDGTGEAVGARAGAGGLGAEDVWRGAVQRSMSVDNVHTGTKGFVRSLAWRTSHRRTSGPYSESVRSSPGRSRGSHASAPVLKDAQWGGARQHPSSGHRLLPTHSPGLEAPTAGAAVPGGAAPPEGDAEGTRGGGKQRTSRENVVRFLGVPDS